MAGTLARAEGFAEMPKYRFNPPLTLKGGVVVRTLDDAAAFVRSYRDPHLPKSSAAVLLSIEEANDKNRGRVAASMFRVWAKAAGVLVSMD
jgi:hypothetical protein